MGQIDRDTDREKDRQRDREELEKETALNEMEKNTRAIRIKWMHNLASQWSEMNRSRATCKSRNVCC